MQKTIMREVGIYAIMLIALALLMHPDLLSSPSDRLALMKEKGNHTHPVLYSLIIYGVIGVLRLLFGWIKKMFIKKDQAK
ncbi:MAG: hypothetical protein U9Q62_04925 [Campylobacterota bacterium]|nr:hypothetical protein [Campylobacterota bacterium]